MREHPLYKKVIRRPDGLTIGLSNMPGVGWIKYTTADRKVFPHTGTARCLDIIMNPANPVTGAPFTDSAGQPCVQGNKILSGCISPVAKNLLEFVPESPSGSVSSLAASPRDGDMWMVRGDWNQSNNHRIYGSYFSDHNKRASPFAAGGSIPNYISESFVQDTRHLTINDTYTISPTLLNQATFTFLDTPSDQVQTRTIDPKDLGINIPVLTSDNAAFFSLSDSFIILRSQQLQGIPLFLNSGVIAHEFSHRVFHHNVYGRGAFGEYYRKNLIESVADTRTTVLILGENASWEERLIAFNCLDSESWKRNGFEAHGLFESLVRSLLYQPWKLNHINRIITDLRATPDGRQLIPAGFDEIWDPIWESRKALPNE